MCAYVHVNNSQSCQNSKLINDLLKGELGFQGFVMSDWQAQHSGVSGALAGLEVAMPGDTLFNTGEAYYGPNLTIAVLNGTVPEWRIDDMVTRILSGYYYVGRDRYALPNGANFDSWTTDTYGYRHFFANDGYEKINDHVDARGDHGALIRDLAAKATVLLKNNGSALPLSGNEKFTAVFGNDAGPAMLGPNGCPDRGCDNGTLGMAWGSGSADFSYLVTPLAAIEAEVHPNVVQGILDNYASSQIQKLASQAGTSLVFVNSDSGEGYIDVDGNEGDRRNLTLWQNGETLVKNVSAECNNTIVIVHSTGPVILDAFESNPNVTAILWAGVPGQESGNSIVDVLYGRVNPGGKLPFTIGKRRQDYGSDLLYTPNNGADAPQANFQEGVFIDYRAFDAHNTTPSYEFGYGLSYTTFAYSDMRIFAHDAPAYTPSSGMTSAAPVLGSAGNVSEYVWNGQERVFNYIYPYLNVSDLRSASGDPDYGSSSFLPANAQDGSAQPVNPNGGAPGGNPALYDVLYTVYATVENTGDVAGDEVAQLYLSLGGPEDPVRVLRGFERLRVAPGEKVQFAAELTRRDVSNWDVVQQKWVVTPYPKEVSVGGSSRDLPLRMALPGSAPTYQRRSEL